MRIDAVVFWIKRLLPRYAYLHQRCVYCLPINSSRPFEKYTNLKLLMFTASHYVVENLFQLPKIPLLPHLVVFEQLYFNRLKAGIKGSFHATREHCRNNYGCFLWMQKSLNRAAAALWNMTQMCSIPVY